MVPLGRCFGTPFGTQGILYSRPTHARVSETNRRQVLNVAVGSALLWLAVHGLRAYTDLSPWVGGNVAKAISTVSASTVSFLLLRLFVFRPKQA
jgi:hypothetical protein